MAMGDDRPKPPLPYETWLDKVLTRVWGDELRYAREELEELKLLKSSQPPDRPKPIPPLPEPLDGCEPVCEAWWDYCLYRLSELGDANDREATVHARAELEELRERGNDHWRHSARVSAPPRVAPRARTPAAIGHVKAAFAVCQASFVCPKCGHD
jgi:hypothetical protein